MEKLNIYHGCTESGKVFEIHFTDENYTLAELVEILTKGLTEKELANQIGIPYGSFRNKRDRVESLGYEDLFKICNYFNIEPSKLFPPINAK